MIKTDKNHRHLSPETPSQGIIAQTPQSICKQHVFSTRTTDKLRKQHFNFNFEKKNIITLQLGTLFSLASR